LKANKKLKLATCLIAILANVSAIKAQTNEEVLGIILDFSKDFCKDIPIQGQGSEVSFSGAGKAKLNSLMSKLVDVGVEGAAKYKNTEYKGLLQTDVLDALKDSTQCRLVLWKDLKNMIVIPNPAETTKKKQ
jgi:hypothetical protein